VKNHEDVEAALAQIIKTNTVIIFFNCFSTFKYFFVNATVENLALRTAFRERLVLQVTYDTAREKFEKFCRGIDDRVVGYQDQRVLKSADANAAEAYILDGSFDPADPDILTHAERLLEHDQDRTQEVRKAIPRGERDREATDTEAGEYGKGGKSQLGRPLHQQRDRNHDADDPHTQPD
jgi:hypothetical protein